MTEIEGDERAVTTGDMDTGRVLALSDGVFAIAATLLVLDLRLPEGFDPADLPAKLHDLLPAFGGYALSYVLIGLLWMSHHRQVRGFTRIGTLVGRLNLLFLGSVSVLPFTTSLLRYDVAIAVTLYALNIVVIFLIEVSMTVTALHLGHHSDPAPVRRRLISTLIGVTVFAASIPLAWIPGPGPALAKYLWLLLFPARIVSHRINNRHAIVAS
jgi:uncharacterized membrane protein